MTVVFFVPILTPNPLNGQHRHWRAASRSRKNQREIVFAETRSKINSRQAPKLPASVSITRVSAGTLDAWDGLPAALKAVVDGIADAYGIADSDPRITWQPFRQSRPAKRTGRDRAGVNIEIIGLGAADGAGSHPAEKPARSR